MKYFKYSIMLLVISIIANYTFTFAYTADELPVSGSVSLNWKDAKTTSIKNKTTSGDQKFKLRESSCSSCTYKISVFAGGILFGIIGIIISLPLAIIIIATYKFYKSDISGKLEDIKFIKNKD